MDRMIIKVTLNSNNPAEAELMKILKDVKNRSAYLKMAAFYYWEIIERFSSRSANKDSEQVLPAEKEGSVNERHDLPHDQVEAQPSFINTFKDISK